MNRFCGTPRSERKKLSCTTSSPLAAGLMNQASVGDSTCAWKPCGVTSNTTVVAGSFVPCPAYVLISGNAWANPIDMTADSHTAKDIIVKLGAGKLSVINPSSSGPVGASASRVSIALRSNLTTRATSGLPTGEVARAWSANSTSTSTNGSASFCDLSTAPALPGAAPRTDASNSAAPTMPVPTRRVRFIFAVPTLAL